MTYVITPEVSSADDSRETKFRLAAISDLDDEQPASLLSKSTSSMATLGTALAWYTTCRDTHSSCHNPAKLSRSWVPTRLIKVAEDELRVCELKGIAGIEYATLSYRWGVESTLRLLQTNKTRLCQGFQASELPQTFRDAIQVMKLLSLEYIWIDTLCILQDSESDWQAESLAMRYVYANSACNIAASCSEDAFGGLFRTREPADVEVGLFKSDDGSLADLIVSDKDYWERQLRQGTLHYRGWVLQECMLAPRVLYFGAHQVLWECLCEARCEGFPAGLPYSQTLKQQLWDEILDAIAEVDTPGRALVMSEELSARWMALAEIYSECALTRHSDRMPAFSGIAKLFYDATGDEYIAGLWRSRLLDQLHWLVRKPQRRIDGLYIAPSWSWASVHGAIQAIAPPAMSNTLADLENITTQLATDDCTGAVQSGSLYMLGNPIRLVFRQTKFYYYSSGKPFEGLIFLDQAEVEDTEECIAYFLPLRAQVCQARVSGLVLRVLLPGEPNVFTRIGYFMTDAAADFEGMELEILGSGLAAHWSQRLKPTLVRID